MAPKNRSLKEQIYTKILYKIVNGKYPHDQFLTEAKLTEEFNVSRILVRETLIELQKDNILKSIPRAGYQIVQISGKEIRDAIRTRSILEIGAARYAINLISDQDIAKLNKLISHAEEARQSREATLKEWWDTNVEFHNVIARASGNALLVEMIDKTISILWRAAVQYFLVREPSTFHGFHPESHKLILEAIQEKDEDKLISLLKEDVTSMSSLFRVD
ncbi:MAG: GntR family transcriptional regulator [Spirochaetales bacterium]|nr:GntR family transcriptional regulator [Spirochaetales bacterium]